MKSVALMLFLLVQLSLFGQIMQPNSSDSSGTQNYFSINITPFFTNKVKYTNQGEELVRSKRLLSGEIGIGYHREIKKNWILQTSIKLGLMPYNFNFEFDAPENSIFQTGPYKEDYETLDFNWSEYSYIRSYTGMDAILSRRIHALKNNDEIHIGAGIHAFIFLVDDFEYDYSSDWNIDDNNPIVNLFYANINDTVSNRLKLSISLEASYIKHFKSKHQFKTAVFFNYSPFKNVEGYYNFSNLGFASSGTFSQNLTYFGLRLNYLIPF